MLLLFSFLTSSCSAIIPPWPVLLVLSPFLKLASSSLLLLLHPLAPVREETGLPLAQQPEEKDHQIKPTPTTTTNAEKEEEAAKQMSSAVDKMI